MRFTGGVALAAGDVFGRGYADIVTAPGAGGTAEVRVFDGRNPNAPGGRGIPDLAYNAYPTSFLGGTTLLVRDVLGQGYASILTVPNAGRQTNVRVYDAPQRLLLQDFVAFDPAYVGGVFLA